MTANHIHDDDDDTSSSSLKRLKTFDNGGVGPAIWSDLNHHMLLLVMMQLGVVDYLSFSTVCKSWRSLALSERNRFMAIKPPMTMRISWSGCSIKSCYLEDFEGRKFKTIPPFVGGTYVGLTCGYLIFFRRKTLDLLLVNPITRHELLFTNFSPRAYLLPSFMRNLKAILVFSRSISEYVFLVMHKNGNQIWFSTASTGAWNRVSCTSTFTDLHAFKGKIYTLNHNHRSHLYELYELRFNPHPKLMLLETKNSLNASHISELVSSDENIYVMDRVPPNRNIPVSNWYRFEELDFGEMKWVSHEKTLGEYASFLSDLKHGVAVNLELWEGRRQGLLLGHNDGDMLKLIQVEKACRFSVNIWYFLHECMKVDRIDW